MEPKTNEGNEAIIEEFMWQMKGDQHNICGQYNPNFCDKQEKRLRTLLTTRDAERDEAYKQGLKDGAVNPGERRRIIDQLRAEVRDEAVEAALLAAEKERVGHMRNGARNGRHHWYL